jgi:AcrR family transcriptional regulator
MGIAERREREKEQLRARIVEAARDLLSEEGLSALSMRAIADRIEYSPATIYLYFKDKDELTHEVVHAGFLTLRETIADELSRVGETATGAEQYGAIGRAYARFAIENTAYFRVMFELPAVASCVECPEPTDRGDADGFSVTVRVVQAGLDDGSIRGASARQVAVVGWGLVHGLTSLYLGGHLSEDVHDHDAFLGLVEDAMASLGSGWRVPEEAAGS